MLSYGLLAAFTVGLEKVLRMHFRISMGLGRIRGKFRRFEL